MDFSTILRLFSAVVFIVLADSKKHIIYWNATNPIFRIDNTMHMIGVRMFDTLIIRCPFVDGTQLVHKHQLALSRIHQVSQPSYDRCTLDDSQQIGVCKRPSEATQLNIVIRPFTPLPGGLEFTAGQKYYFISTSTGRPSGLSNRHGGLCETHNMKLVIDVLPDADSSAAQLSSGTTTPVMYIVHTRRDNMVTRDDVYYDYDDDRGGGPRPKSTTMLMLAIITLGMIMLDIRLLI